MLFVCTLQSITDIAFGGRDGGYMSWTPVNIDRGKDIVFQFRTEEPEGLILYTANDDGVSKSVSCLRITLMLICMPSDVHINIKVTWRYGALSGNTYTMPVCESSFL